MLGLCQTVCCSEDSQQVPASSSRGPRPGSQVAPQSVGPPRGGSEAFARAPKSASFDEGRRKSEKHAELRTTQTAGLGHQQKAEEAEALEQRFATVPAKLPGPFGVMRSGSRSQHGLGGEPPKSSTESKAPAALSDAIVQDRLRAQLAERSQDVEKLLKEGSRRRQLVMELEKEAFRKEEELHCIRQSLASLTQAMKEGEGCGVAIQAADQATVAKLHEELQQREAQEADLKGRLEALRTTVAEREREVESKAEATLELACQLSSSGVLGPGPLDQASPRVSGIQPEKPPDCFEKTDHPELQRCGLPVVLDREPTRHAEEASEPRSPSSLSPASRLGGVESGPATTTDAAHTEACEQLLELQRAGVSVELQFAGVSEELQQVGS